MPIRKLRSRKLEGEAGRFKVRVDLVEAGLGLLAGGLGQMTSRGPIQPQPFCHSVIFILLVPKKHKAAFLNCMADKMGFVYDVSPCLPEVIHSSFVCFHHLLWLVNVLLYFCCVLS